MTSKKHPPRAPATEPAAARLDESAIDEEAELLLLGVWPDDVTARAEHRDAMRSQVRYQHIQRMRVRREYARRARATQDVSARALWAACKALPEAKRKGIEFYDSSALHSSH